MKIIEDAIKRGANNLSEFESKQILSAYGVPVTSEKTAKTLEETVSAANSIGYPIVLKASGENLQHKTELDLIRLDLKDESQVIRAYKELLSENTIPITEVLIQQMLRGNRELMAGLKRDSQFGPCVVFGLGGVLAEILEDVSIRVAPITTFDAMDMMENIRGKKILEPFRGKPPVDRKALAELLIALGKIGLENDAVGEIDINPIKLIEGRPVAVDALIVLE
ncbi:MAG: acetate--CoA ligase family protein [Deltaproteobacteria bacterium]|nr:acetate--CoA ligase family protein [Deltaproteobacteria bacterium]